MLGMQLRGFRWRTARREGWVRAGFSPVRRRLGSRGWPCPIRGGFKWIAAALAFRTCRSRPVGGAAGPTQEPLDAFDRYWFGQEWPIESTIRWMILQMSSGVALVNRAVAEQLGLELQDQRKLQINQGNGRCPRSSSLLISEKVVTKFFAFTEGRIYFTRAGDAQ